MLQPNPPERLGPPPTETASLDSRTCAKLETPAPVDAGSPPRTLGDRFELLEQIGEGGMGVVYRAYDWLSDEVVAIKLLRAHEGDEGGRTAERFRRELRAARSVTHPGVVRIHELFAFDGRLALSMQLVEGETLDARIRRDGARAADAVVRLARELAEGLACAHAEGIVHRDLKPSNILLRRDDGRAMISDFGISRIAQAQPEGEADWVGPSPRFSNMTRGVLGTPAYMAPEQLRDPGAADARSDVYALGLVLFEAATGRLPQRELTGNQDVATPAAPARDALPENLPAWLIALILRCLEPDPTARFASGVELLVAVRACGGDAREQPRFGLRRAAWTALAVTLAAALAAPLLQKPPVGLPTRDRRVFVQAAAAPGVSERVRLATERLAHRALVERGLSFRVVEHPEQANVRLRLELQASGDGIVLAPAIGPTDGELTPGSTARGTSARGALDAALDELVATLSADQPRRAADAEERRAMTRLGLDSLDQLLAYDAALAAQFETSGLEPSSAVNARVEALLGHAPAWARTHLLCELLNQMSLGKDWSAALSPVDRSRDPQGVRLLDSVRVFFAGDRAQAEQMQSALYREAPHDPLIAVIYASTLSAQAHRTSELVAVLRAVHARWPSFSFGGWIATALPMLGRDDEVSAFVADWVQRAPEGASLQHAIMLGAKDEDASGMDALVDDYLLLHGDGVQGMAEIVDALIVADRHARASELAEQMLVSEEPLTRQLGRRRLGDIELLSGRFAAGRRYLEQALDASDPTGRYTEMRESLSALVGLAQLLGEDAMVAAHSARLAAALHEDQEPLASLFEQVLGVARPTCAKLKKRAAALPAEAQGLVKAHAQRHLALRGCVPCTEVVRQGLLPVEGLQLSLHAFGVCALSTGDARLAREAFRRATVTVTGGMEVLPSPVHGVLAWYGLGQAHEALGDSRAAQEAYEQFLTRWKGAELPLPQLTDARRRLDALRGIRVAGP